MSEGILNTLKIQTKKFESAIGSVLNYFFLSHKHSIDFSVFPKLLATHGFFFQV